MTTEAREDSHDPTPHETYDMLEAVTMADPDPPIEGLTRCGTSRRPDERNPQTTDNPG
jgi:hypothetical protein